MTDNERDLIDAVLQGSATINQLRLAVLNERATADWKRQVIEAQQLVNQDIEPDHCSFCPNCNNRVDYRRFSLSIIICPECSCRLVAIHDCGSEPDYECTDRLEPEAYQ